MRKEINMLVLGESEVGKTSFLLRWVNDTFGEQHYFPDMLISDTKQLGTKEAQLEIEEVPHGQPVFAMQEQMAFLLWDQSKPDTFEKINSRYAAFKDNCEDLMQNPVLSLFPKGFDFKNFPILFVACKTDLVEDPDFNTTEEEIRKLANQLQIENYDIAFTSAKDDLGFGETLDKKVISLLDKSGALLAKEEVNKIIDKDGDIDFQASKFKHSRGVRVKHLRAVHLKMAIRKLKDDALPDDEKSTKISSQKDVLWLLLHSQSIKHAESKTVSFINKCINAYEDEDDGDYPFVDLEFNLRCNDLQEFISKLQEVSCRWDIYFRSEDDSSIAFDTIIKLLTLLDEKERKVFGYKIVLFQSSRDLVRREMGLIIDLAKHIYDYYVQEEKPRQGEGNDNNADLGAPIPDEILQNLAAKHNVSIPAEVEKIISELIKAPEESHSTRAGLQSS